MEAWRKNFILCAGFFEALFFSGCLFGWPSLLLVLQQEGVYQHVCVIKNEVELNHSMGINVNHPTYETSHDNKTGTGSSENLEDNISQESQYIDVKRKEFQWKLDCDKNCSSEREKYLSNDDNTPVANFYEDKKTSCDIQRIEMTLVYTFAAVIYGIIAAFIGMSLEFMGLRITRLIGSACGCVGFVFLAVTTSEKPYFLWPALNLIGLGTNMLRFSGFLFADLVPEYRATVITTYSSAYSISTTFFLLMQIIYEGGVSSRVIFFGCAGGCALTFLPTFFMPVMQIMDHRGETKALQEAKSEDPDNAEKEEAESQGSHLMDDLSTEGKKSPDPDKILPVNEDVPDQPAKSKPRIENMAVNVKRITLRQSLRSISGVLHMNWQFINLFLILFYSSTFNIWALKVTDDIRQVSFYIKMSGVCCIIAPLFVPMFGYITDRMISQANKLTDPVEQLAHKMQAPVFAMGIATFLLTSTMICKMFLNETAIYISLILIALSRPAVIGSCTSYIRLRFPANQFNLLNGVFTTIISILCFIQYPIMKWMTHSPAGYQQVHWVLTIYVLISLTSPGHMLIRKNIIAYARRRLGMV